jgi:Tfp pilus tip-associated adhesin PilY1
MIEGATGDDVVDSENSRISVVANELPFGENRSDYRIMRTAFRSTRADRPPKLFFGASDGMVMATSLRMLLE